jgi:lysophospholipase L1-like esterase
MKPFTIRAIATGVIIAAVVVSGWVLFQRSRQRAASDVIVERWDRLGGQEWLRPNLRRARIVVPDRPHSLGEVHAWRKGESDSIHRTRTFFVDTNADRIRGDAVAAKAPGTTRIIALGDSVTHGWGVTEDESYPARLEEALRGRGHAVQVLNAGVPSNPIPVMADWCRNVAPDFAPDIILWTRRPPAHLANPFKGYVGALKQCAQATGAQLIVVLPPVSTFDVRGSESWEREADQLQKRLAQHDIPIIELTGGFRAAQQGRGEILEVDGDALKVIDQESGRVWLEARRTRHDLPTEIYALFERESEVKEALFFDGGHPDVEGYRLMAQTVASVIEQRILKTPG